LRYHKIPDFESEYIFRGEKKELFYVVGRAAAAVEMLISNS
jgi:hypothetical protein